MCDILLRLWPFWTRRDIYSFQMRIMYTYNACNEFAYYSIGSDESERWKAGSRFFSFNDHLDILQGVPFIMEQILLVDSTTCLSPWNWHSFFNLYRVVAFFVNIVRKLTFPSFHHNFPLSPSFNSRFDRIFENHIKILINGYFSNAKIIITSKM